MLRERDLTRIGRCLRIFGAGVFAAISAGFAADTGVVELVRPKDLSTVVGPATIEASVKAPEGATIESVVFTVDGKAVATKTAPPWKAEWDGGDGSRTRFVQVVARFSDGTERRASARTSPLKVDLVEQVALVNLYAIVRDKQGNYVTDLKKESFSVTEDTRPEQIERFGTEWKPLRIGIVLDTSLSMEGNKLDAARDAAVAFLDTLRPGDQAIVVTFGEEVKVAQESTDDKKKLEAAIRATRASGGTALYDAIWKTADLLDKQDGRRVMVLLSDGFDQSTSGLEPGSFHTDQEALDRALRAETMIFSIGFGRNLATEWDFFRKRSLEDILRELAETTGGRATFSSRTAKLQRAFEEVAEDLRHQYSLAYTPDDTRSDGGWRKIDVKIDRPGAAVITRKGYFAPKAKRGSGG